jgi:hypothetical protein
LALGCTKPPAIAVFSWNVKMRVFMRIFGPKNDELTIIWRKLHNEELHNLYPSANIVRMIK